MNIKSIYDTVVLRSPCSHNQFLTHLDMTVRTLTAQYSMPYVVLGGKSYGFPRSVENDIPVHEEYYPAIVDNILFLLTGDTDRKTDYVQEAESAYKAVWSRMARGRTIRGRGYYDV